MKLKVVREKKPDGEMKEFYDYKEFREYLKNLPTERPFGCKNLVVLTERIYSGEAGQIYEEGELICSAKPGSLGTPGMPTNHRCSINSDLIMNKDGSFEMQCGWNRTRIRIE